MLKKCPFSGELFTPKRRNQVFASPKNRRDFHNKNMAELRQAKSDIDKILLKNFVILQQVVREENKAYEFPLDALVKKGFNPYAFTHMTVINGKASRFLYDFMLDYTEKSVYVTKTIRHD